MLISQPISKSTLVTRLMRDMLNSSGSCPCHSSNNSNSINSPHYHGQRTLSAGAKPLFDYAFEMATSTVRYGPGVTAEVGEDLKVWMNNIKKSSNSGRSAATVAVFTDKNLISLSPIKTLLASLDRQSAHFKYRIYSETRVEPTDHSLKHAINWTRDLKPDAIVAFGGGSGEAEVR